MNILVINAGSSSLKYQLMNSETADVLAKGLCERIGIDGMITHKLPDGRKIEKEIAMPDHAAAFKILIDTLVDPEIGCIANVSEIDAVGHRVVHGGEFFSGSVSVTPEVIKTLEVCSDLAPLHNPPAITGIRSCTQVMGDIPQVAVFDTAFHQTMPDYAYFYPIPYEYYEKYKIRRYGFHGTSHRYVSAEMTKILGKTEGTRIITCHLGNGSSITAVKDGKSVDTTMGFTPLDGLEMGTRCGSIDPAIVTFLMEKEGITSTDINNIMNKKSGLLGVSGISSDSRDIENAVKAGNARAALASKILSYEIKKYIGSYAAAMGGVDAIVFTAGIGENSAPLRAEVCKDLAFIGVDFDDERNAERSSDPRPITKDGSKVQVYVIPTNEELVIAMDTAEIVKNA